MNAALPNELQALKTRGREQQDKLAAREAEIEPLKLIIAKLRRLEFGRRSERRTEIIGQLELSPEELEGTCAEAPPVAESPATEVTPSPHHKPLPAHLPRESILHRPDTPCCPSCGGELKRLGEDVSEPLDYVPAGFRVIRPVRPKFACAKCDALVQTNAPSRPIARGRAGAGLLAHALVAKYADHLPLYRQSEIHAREGVELSRSTLAEWVGQCQAL